MKLKLSQLAILCSLAVPMLSFAEADFAQTKVKLERALQNPNRAESSKQRDENRKPVETLEFFGLRDDMQVLEILPGGGWYTEILAPTLAEKGKLHLWFYGDFTRKQLEKRDDLSNAVEQIHFSPFDFKSIKATGKYSEQYPLEFEEPVLEVPPLDMVLSVWAHHVFTDESQLALNRAVYKALKPGGIYAVVDHTRRHMQSEYDENWRRADPVQIILDMQKAGFVLEDYSTLHYHADDELRYEVGRPSVQGHTDRFTLKFRKPK